MRLNMEAIRRCGSQRGSTLPLALMVLMLVSALGMTAFSLGMTEVAIGTNWKQYSAAFYAADAGTEWGVSQLRDLLSKNPKPTVADLNAITPPTFLAAKNLTFTQFTIAGVVANPPVPYPTTFGSGPYAGLSGLVSDYQVTAQVVGEGGTSAQVSQIVQYVQVPLFQFGVFYGKGVDLEIAPGPAMTFNGRVHANSDLYMQASSNGMKFDSYVTSAGKVYRGLKRDPTDRGYDPDIKDASGVYQKLDFDREYKPGFSEKWGSDAEWKAHTEGVYGDILKDSAMGVGQIVPPIPELFYNPSNPDVVSHQMIELPKAGDSPELKQAKLYSQAGIRIIDGVATDQNGNPVTIPGGAITNKSFWDAREGKTVNVVEIDVDKFNPAKPKNGLVYVGSTSLPTASDMPAVRLVNGGSLPKDGLSIASPNPVYIKGDYNKDAWGAKNSNGEDVFPPAAVMADAITVLSGNWDDTKGAMTAGDRSANDTIVNAAFALGPSTESTLGAGNGQLENVIRFLEDWNGKELKYRGSIISLWHSQQAQGQWRCCSTSDPYHYYRPPTRNWGYDPNFNTTPPPGTPMGVIMVRGQWTQQ